MPEGWRAEIVATGITMTPPSGKGHATIVTLVHRALNAAVREDWAVCRNVGVSIPLRLKLFVPDLVVIPWSALGGADNEPVPAEQALLVVEITSPGNAQTDRKPKRWGYAHGDVPQYLLIDRFDDDGPSITLFTEPVDGHHQQIQRLPFGRKVRLPEPFEVDLDTSRF